MDYTSRYQKSIKVKGGKKTEEANNSAKETNIYNRITIKLWKNTFSFKTIPLKKKKIFLISLQPNVISINVTYVIRM